MKTILLSISLFLYSCIPIFADYAAPELFDMVGASDLVILGSIINVTEETFILKIDDVLCGKYKDNTIEIYKYKGWECSIRWSDYEKGQKEIVFLDKHTNKKQNSSNVIYTLRSAGSEGELPIVEDIVFCPFYFKGIPHEKYGKNYFQRLVLNDLLSAIKNYRNCYKLTRNKTKWPEFDMIEQICTDEELEKYEWNSFIHRYLSATTKIRLKYYINK